MRSLLQALAARATLQQRVAIVVAHPDDETIAAGGSLHLMPDLLLVHVTDGAPRRRPDAANHGFDTPAAYAAAREAELRAALSVTAVEPERVRLGVPDQDASLHLCDLVASLAPVLAQHGVQAVLTHAYEGGHPDHDATAFATHLAARRVGIPVLEFPGYHAGPDGEMEVQRFLPGPAETLVRLRPEEAAVKRAMFDCFATQASVLRPFGASVERFRPAPGYDFMAAPHAGPLNYENWGWPMTGRHWRELAAEAMRDFACAD